MGRKWSIHGPHYCVGVLSGRVLLLFFIHGTATRNQYSQFLTSFSSCASGSASSVSSFSSGSSAAATSSSFSSFLLLLLLLLLGLLLGNWVKKGTHHLYCTNNFMILSKLTFTYEHVQKSRTKKKKLFCQYKVCMIRSRSFIPSRRSLMGMHPSDFRVWTSSKYTTNIQECNRLNQWIVNYVT